MDGLMTNTHKLSRRGLLRSCVVLAGGAGLAGLIGGCGPSQGASGSAKAISSSATATSADKPAAPPPVSAAPSTASRSGSLHKVSFGTVGANFNPFIAMDQGYFAEQGIELDLIRFDSGASMVAPLGTGQLDTGGGAISAGLWNAVARGVPVKLVADLGHTDATPPGFPQQELLVRKALFDDGSVKSATDIKGLKVGVPMAGTSVEYAMVKMLQKVGLTINDFDAIAVAPTDFAAAMSNGKVDAAFAIQQSATILVTEGIATHLMYDSEAAPENQSVALMFGPRFADSDLPVAFMTAYLEGIRTYNDAFRKKQPAAREKAIDAIIKYTGVKDRSVYEKQTWFVGIDPDGRLRPPSLQEQQEYFLSTGTQTSRVDIGQVVEPRYAEQAVARLGPYR